MKKNTLIYEITPLIYEQLTIKLMELIATPHFTKVSIELDFDQMHLHFTASLFPSFSREELPEGVFERIDNLTPVWWEMHTYINNREIINDFDLSILTDIICSR